MRWRKRAAESLLASYQFILPYYYGKKLYVKVILWLREFAYGAGPEILNPYVALQVWAGTPDSHTAIGRGGERQRAHRGLYHHLLFRQPRIR